MTCAECGKQTDNHFNVTNATHGGKDTLCDECLEAVRHEEKVWQEMMDMHDPTVNDLD